MQRQNLQKWEASDLVWHLSLSRISRIWHPRIIIPLRHNGKSILSEQWDGLNNTPIINTCSIRTFWQDLSNFVPQHSSLPSSNSDPNLNEDFFFSLLSWMAYGWDKKWKNTVPKPTHKTLSFVWVSPLERGICIYSNSLQLMLSLMTMRMYVDIYHLLLTCCERH